MDEGYRLDDKNIWRMVNTTLLACIGLGCAKSRLGISVIDLRIILTLVIMILIVMYMDRVSARGRLLGIAGIGAVLFGIGMIMGFRQCLLFGQSYWRWLLNLSGWRGEWHSGYEAMQTVILVLFCYLFEFLTEKNFRVKIIGAAMLATGLLYALFAEKEMSKPGVAFLICYVVLTYVEWTQRRWNKERGRSIQAYMLWIVPFVAVYFVFLMLCAVPDEPYDWKLVKNVYQYFSESFRKVSQNIIRGGDEDYELSLSGFSDRGDIDGSRMESDREIMTIRDADGLVTNVYLSGNVYDTFDGRQWKCFNEDTSKERYMDTAETMYAVRRYDNKYFTDYLKYADFQIDYRYFHSRYLFTPLKLLNVIYKGESLDFYEEGGSLFFDNAKGYGTEYEVSFYQLNAGQDAFDRFLNEAGAWQPEEEILTKILKDLEKRTGVSVTADDMEAHRQEIFAHYTEEVEISDEVKEYIDEITEGAQTDAERLRMIEIELSGFTYTLTPDDLPGTVTNSGEFLDYFLLDGREGYCSHFATAFVLLARAQGLPARYVQGFCVPVSGKEEVPVYSDMAHAWPEVYLDGIGWIPYEPTPGYSQVRYTPWTVWNENDDFDTGGNRLRGNGGNIAAAQEQPEDSREDNGTEFYEVRNNLLRLMQMIGIMLLVAGASVSIVCILNRLIADYRYNRMNAKEQFKTIVRRNMQIMSLMGIKRGQETLDEFRKRVEGDFPDKDMLRFIGGYEGVLYGNEEADKELIAMTQKQQEELLLLLKKKKRWLYIYCRFWIRSK